MSDWHECPNAQECTEGNRFGKGCVVDPAQSAMGGKPWHECHCGVDSDGNPPNLRQADEITRLRNALHIAQMLTEWNREIAVNARELVAENERLRGQAEFEKKCRNDAFDELKKQDAEIERLRGALERLSCKCPSNCDWEKHGDICPSWVARAALEGL